MSYFIVGQFVVRCKQVVAVDLTKVVGKQVVAVDLTKVVELSSLRYTDFQTFYSLKFCPIFVMSVNKIP